MLRKYFNKHTMKRFILSVAAVAMSIATFAQNALPFDPEVKVGKLDNGLTYYIRHNGKPAERADFYLVSNVGAIEEGQGQDGLAHFLEHMCFNGLKNLPGKQMLEYLQSIGASFGGNINASTGVEVTQYMLNNIPVVREGIVDTCLLVMHDYSHFVLNDPAEVDAERGVILEEKRTRNTASWRMFEGCAPYLYGDTKYGTCNVIGSEETLKTFPAETLVDFYQTWYRPDNQAVIVVGDVDVDQIEAKLVKLFADIPAPVNPRPKDVITLPENTEPVIGIVTDKELQTNSIEVIWKRPAVPVEYNNTDQVYALDVVCDLFSMVMSERFNDITSKPGAPFMSANLGYGNLIRTTDAVFGSISFKNGEDLQALNAYLTEYERVRRYGVTEAELQRAKDNLLASCEKAAQGAESRKNPDFIRPIINSFVKNTPFMEPSTKYEITKMICAQLPAAAVNQIIAQYLTDDNMIVLVEGSALVEHPSEQEVLDVINATRAAEVEAPAEEVSDIALLDESLLKGSKVKSVASTIAGAKVWTLKNGVRVVVLPTDYKKDEVSFRLTMNGGESLIPTEDLASFESNVWQLYLQNSGLSKFTSSELSKVLAGKSVSVYPWIESETHGISGTSTPKDLETALQLIYLNFMDQRFDEDEFQIGIDQIKAILPNLDQNPQFQLQKRLPGDLYTPADRHPLISQEIADQADVKVLEKNYKMLFKDAAGATLYIVGNVDEAELKPLVEKYIGSLPKGKKPLNWVDNGDRFRSGEYVDHFTAQMTTPKSSVFQLYSAALPATVENQVLLSATSYILNMIYTDTLREEEGGTYGASVSGQYLRRPIDFCMVQVYFDTNVEQAPALIALAKKGVTELAENGPSDEFFTRTVENFKNRLPQARITNSYWMDVLNNYDDFGYNEDICKEEVINALTKEKIRDFAKKLVDAGNYIEINMNPAE